MRTINVFELLVSLSIDTKDFEKGLQDSEKTASRFGSSMKSGLGKAGTAFKAVAKTVVAGTAAAATAVGALAKQSLDAYAEYEQLVGGVETLFKDSADVVQQYAANAYKTAGLSANEYMETVTSFSASLLQSLEGDTAKAAKYADMAITDMSDNANKMGTSMEAIQNAYQGFAKQNYTMLDNLKLGYGGTKEEMLRLLDDAQKISGIEYDISSYADIVAAIHVIQTQMDISGYSVDELNSKLKDMSLTQEEVRKIAEDMGISYEEASKRMSDGSLTIQDASVLLGTTAKEAATTIQGSIASAKSAWQNLLVGLADENADIDLLINNFVDSVVIAGDNIIPRIDVILSGIASAIEKLAPKLIEKIPTILQNVLPSLITGAQAILTAAVQVLPSILDLALNTVLPELINLAVTVIGTLLETVSTNFLTLLSSVVDSLTSLLTELFTAENVSNAVRLIITFIKNVIGGILGVLPTISRTVVDVLGNIISALPTVFEDLLGTIPDLLLSITQSITENTSILLEGLGTLIEKLAEALPDIFDSLVEDFIPGLMKVVVDLIVNQLPTLINGVVALFKGIISALPSIIDVLVNGIPKIITTLLDAVSDNQVTIIDGLTAVINMWFADIMPVIMMAIMEMLPELLKVLIDNIMLTLPDVILALTKFGTQVALAGPEIIWSILKSIPDLVKRITTKMTNEFTPRAKKVGKELTEGLWKGIQDNATQLWNNIKGWLDGIWNGILDYFEIKSPSRKMRDVVGKNLVLGLAEGINNEGDTAVNATLGLARDISNVGFSMSDIAQDVHANVGTTERVRPSFVINVNNPVVREKKDIDKIVQAVSSSLADEILRSGMSWGGVYA